MVIMARSRFCCSLVTKWNARSRGRRSPAFFGERMFLGALSIFVSRDNKRSRIILATQFGWLSNPLGPVSSFSHLFLYHHLPSFSLHPSLRSSLLFFFLNRDGLSLSLTLYIELNGIVMRRPRLQFPLCRLVFLLFPRLFVHLSLLVSLTLLSTFILLLSLSDHDRLAARERLCSDVYIREYAK